MNGICVSDVLACFGHSESKANRHKVNANVIYKGLGPRNIISTKYEYLYPVPYRNYKLQSLMLFDIYTNKQRDIK